MVTKGKPKPKNFDAKVAVRNIAYLQALHNMTDMQMARVIGKSKATWSARKNQKPQDMTLAELIKAAEFFKIPSAAQLLVPFEGNEVLPYAVE